jgi:hypothetical protein
MPLRHLCFVSVLDLSLIVSQAYILPAPVRPYRSLA